MVEAPTPRSEAVAITGDPVAITGLRCKCQECLTAIEVDSSEEEREGPIADSSELEFERKTAEWEYNSGEYTNAYIHDYCDEEVDGC